MSDHKIPLTNLERSGLQKHGLPTESPSQLSDAFRHGVKWAQGDDKPVAYRIEWEDGGVEFLSAPLPALGEDPLSIMPLFTHPPASKVPKGWKIRRMPYDTWEAGKIQVSSPDGDHCMVERREQMAPHHPMNMFYALAEALMPNGLSKPEPQEVK